MYLDNNRSTNGVVTHLEIFGVKFIFLPASQMLSDVSSILSFPETHKKQCFISFRKYLPEKVYNLFDLLFASYLFHTFFIIPWNIYVKKNAIESSIIFVLL